MDERFVPFDVRRQVQVAHQVVDRDDKEAAQENAVAPQVVVAQVQWANDPVQGDDKTQLLPKRLVGGETEQGSTEVFRHLLEDVRVKLAHPQPPSQQLRANIYRAVAVGYRVSYQC
jgi:hypothetical protein